MSRRVVERLGLSMAAANDRPSHRGFNWDKYLLPYQHCPLRRPATSA
jgi:hypothetical protein